MNSRILALNNVDTTEGTCVIYVMGRDQRMRDNHALLAAQAEALDRKLPLVAAFNLFERTGYRRREHYQFMIDGLRELESELAKKSIPFVMLIGAPQKNLMKFMEEHEPASVYFDFSPLRGPRRLQKKIADKAACRVSVVDTHNIVPAWVISDKEEYAAHTLRRKLHRLVGDWLKEPDPLKKHPFAFDRAPRGADWNEVQRLVDSFEPNGINHGFTPGESAARHALDAFNTNGLSRYADRRNDPTEDGQSNLSPYLHFGQLSSLRIVLDIMDSHPHPPQLLTSFKMPSFDGAPGINDSIDAFIEELVVRKELSDNFCFYNNDYDSLTGVRDWAKKSLAEHADDPRDSIYTKRQLEHAETHDELWNAAQLQLTRSGKIHGYMRMYWAKKILEWTNTPETAVRWAIELNDTYHLDGGDPNGYVGVLWSIAGVHDRPWFNRSVYGTIRYMSADGMRKKFDVDAYVQRWVDK